MLSVCTMNEQELIHAIALTKLPSLSLLNARLLFESTGSAVEVFAHRKDIKSIVPDANDRLVHALDNADEALALAEKEMEFISKGNVRAMLMTDEDYPQRMLECADAPLVLYACGKVDLNCKHVLNVVGTRKCSEYGKDICKRFIAELKELVPDALVVSGLAYGIDIHAHRAALEQGMNTVGVLAHGLDLIYPRVHRQTAVDMVHNGGGLLTEYVSGTTPEKINFVRRNRIVAGISDACVVVESAARGGSLITANLALDYNRDVFAFPGRVFDECSAGCNKLIKNHEATLIENAEDFVVSMGWAEPRKSAKDAVQRELFVELTDEEQRIVDTLRNVDDKHINQISVEANVSYSKASMVLFELEMKGVIKALGGARYRMLR